MLFYCEKLFFLRYGFILPVPAPAVQQKSTIYTPKKHNPAFCKQKPRMMRVFFNCAHAQRGGGGGDGATGGTGAEGGHLHPVTASGEPVAGSYSARGHAPPMPSGRRMTLALMVGAEMEEASSTS